MQTHRKSILLGSFWGAVKFVLAFGRSVLLVPLLLTVEGKEFYALWVVLAAANAAYMGVFDGFIRYVSNAFNVAWHTDQSRAMQLLQSGRKLLFLISVGLLLVVTVVFVVFPHSIAAIFQTDATATMAMQLPVAVLVFAIGTTAIQWLRLFYVVNEPVGKLWQGYCFELFYGLVEVGIIVVTVLQHGSFSRLLVLMGFWYLLAAVVYGLVLRVQYKGAFSLANNGSLQEGAKMLGRSFYNTVDGLADRVTGESLSFVLSLLLWPAAVIAQFASVKALTNAGITGMSLLQAPWQPPMQRAYAQRQLQTLYCMWQTLWLFAAGAGFSICLLFPLLEKIYILFTKRQIQLDSAGFTLLLATLVLAMFGQVQSGFLRAVNKNKLVLWASGGKAIGAVVLFVLLPHSLFYIGLGLALLEGVSTLIFYPLLTHYVLRGMDDKRAVQHAYASVLPMAIVAGSVVALLWFSNVICALTSVGCIILSFILLREKKAMDEVVIVPETIPAVND